MIGELRARRPPGRGLYYMDFEQARALPAVGAFSFVLAPVTQGSGDSIAITYFPSRRLFIPALDVRWFRHASRATPGRWLITMWGL